MIIIHIESGLGNQMLDYVEYLAIKRSNPKNICYIEKIIFDISESHKFICQWNGYELEKIFNIKIPEVRQVFNDKQWNNIIETIQDSRFWDDNWNYPVVFTNCFKNEGYKLENLKGDYSFKLQKEQKLRLKSKIRHLLTKFFETRIGNSFKRILRKTFEKYIIERETGNNNHELFRNYLNRDIFTGHSLKFMYKNSGIEELDKEIRQAYTFPRIQDNKNKEMERFIKSVSSVAIHARRGDMLTTNGYCYKYGYFKRAVKYIKKHVNNPVFIFFCDGESEGWCRDNEEIFGLNFVKDEVHFVNWNTGEYSYLDMQLMSLCKHNITTESSFGWWGAFLNSNPNKITCSPNVIINTTNSF